MSATDLTYHSSRRETEGRGMPIISVSLSFFPCSPMYGKPASVADVCKMEYSYTPLGMNMQGSNCYATRRENLNLHKTDPPLKPPRWGGEEEEEKFCENVSSSFGSWGPLVSFALILWAGEEGLEPVRRKRALSFSRILFSNHLNAP